MIATEDNRPPHTPKAPGMRIGTRVRWLREEVGRTEAEIDRVIQENLAPLRPRGGTTQLAIFIQPG